MHLAFGGRAGLVGTNSISQNRGRSASLEYIVGNGGVIVSAVSTQDWPGEAAVDVSIVNWLKGADPPPGRLSLDGIEVEGITTALRPRGRDVSSAVALDRNRGRCFYGPIPAGRGFVLSREVGEEFLARSDARYREVIRPYLVGDDIAKDPSQQPRRYIIDFGLRTLEQAMEYPEALKVVELLVRPERAKTRRKAYRERWWRFAEPIVAMREALSLLSRYVAANTQGKRLLLCWVDPWTCPSNLTTVFAFEDDYAMGVLSSSVHEAWARAQSSTLEDRLRYTPTSAFETFPWPYPVTDEQREAVADASRVLIARRTEICRERKIGLTKLYNQVDDGAWADLRELHRRLDEAVAAAYGWSARIAQDAAETNARLLALNREIAAGTRLYAPFG